jgi:hypothetical protein
LICNGTDILDELMEEGERLIEGSADHPLQRQEAV